ncbi:MAG TPA: TetR/AcrR family transcriptional regulator [Campylobacterales bacterium]|nr:TetR/AcrR family transcriptional regulator [Campylobacterales bacterium]
MKQETREKLIDSAFNTFYRQGYQGANIASILKEVNINKGSMYHYFKSKKELGLAVVDERIRQNIKDKYQSILKSKTPYQTLFETLRLSPDTLIYGCPLNKMSQEMVYIDEEFNKLLSSVYEDFEKSISQILNKAIEVGEIPSCTPNITARLIISTYEGALMIYHLNRDRGHYNAVIDELERQFNHLA